MHALLNGVCQQDLISRRPEGFHNLVRTLGTSMLTKNSKQQITSGMYELTVKEEMETPTAVWNVPPPHSHISNCQSSCD
jgi:hypothetical protein